LVRYLIKKSTGFDIGEKKTIEQIKNAHTKFLELYKNSDISKIVIKYKEICKYNKDASTIKIENLQDYNNQLESLHQLIGKTLIELREHDGINKGNLFESIKIELDNNLNKVNRLNKILENYENIVVFKEKSKIELEYIKERCVQIENQLISIINKIKDIHDTSETKTLTFDDFILFDLNRIKTLLKEINDFQMEINNIKLNSKKYTYVDLCGFANKLEEEIKNIGFNNVLLSDGFCDIEIEIINAFLDADSRMQWGGIFTDKIDAMHFGFKTQYVKGIIK